MLTKELLSLVRNPKQILRVRVRAYLFSGVASARAASQSGVLPRSSASPPSRPPSLTGWGASHTPWLQRVLKITEDRRDKDVVLASCRGTRSQDKGYKGRPGKRVTTGCRWQTGGLWGRSDASLWPSPLPRVTSPPSPPSPCLWGFK